MKYAPFVKGTISEQTVHCMESVSSFQMNSVTESNALGLDNMAR